MKQGGNLNIITTSITYGDDKTTNLLDDFPNVRWEL